MATVDDDYDAELEELRLAALRTLKKRKHSPSSDRNRHSKQVATPRNHERSNRFADQPTGNSNKITDLRASITSSRLNSRSNVEVDDLGDIDQYDVDIGLDFADTTETSEHLGKVNDSDRNGEVAENPEQHDDDAYHDNFEQQEDYDQRGIDCDEEIELSFVDPDSIAQPTVPNTHQDDATSKKRNFRNLDDRKSARFSQETAENHNNRDGNASSFTSASSRRDGRTHTHSHTSQRNEDRPARAPVHSRLHNATSGQVTNSSRSRNEGEFDLRAKLGSSRREQQQQQQQQADDDRTVVGTRVTVGSRSNGGLNGSQRGRNRNWRWTFS